MSRRLTIAVVNETDQFHEALAKWQGQKFKKEDETILFIYNIGPENIRAEDHSVQYPRVLVVANNDCDMITLKPYGKDYLTATADATVLAGRLCGVDCSMPDYYNFFEQPKTSLYDAYVKATNENK